MAKKDLKGKLRAQDNTTVKAYIIVYGLAAVGVVLYVAFLVLRGIQETDNPPTRFQSPSFKPMPVPGIAICGMEPGVNILAYTQAEDGFSSCFYESGEDFNECSGKVAPNSEDSWFEGCYLFNHMEDGTKGISFSDGESYLTVFFEVAVEDLSFIYWKAVTVGLYNQTFGQWEFGDYYYIGFDKVGVGRFSISRQVPLGFDVELGKDQEDPILYFYNLALTEIEVTTVRQNASSASYFPVELILQIGSFQVPTTEEFHSVTFFSIVSAVGGFASLVGSLTAFFFMPVYRPKKKFRFAKKAEEYERKKAEKANKKNGGAKVSPKEESSESDE